MVSFLLRSFQGFASHIKVIVAVVNHSETLAFCLFWDHRHVCFYFLLCGLDGSRVIAPRKVWEMGVVQHCCVQAQRIQALIQSQCLNQPRCGWMMMDDVWWMMDDVWWMMCDGWWMIIIIIYLIYVVLFWTLKDTLQWRGNSLTTTNDDDDGWMMCDSWWMIDWWWWWWLMDGWLVMGDCLIDDDDDGWMMDWWWCVIAGWWMDDG